MEEKQKLQKAEQGKKAYRPPELSMFGSIAMLTETNMVGMASDGSGMMDMGTPAGGTP